MVGTKKDWTDYDNFIYELNQSTRISSKVKQTVYKNRSRDTIMKNPLLLVLFFSISAFALPDKEIVIRTADGNSSSLLKEIKCIRFEDETILLDMNDGINDKSELVINGGSMVGTGGATSSYFNGVLMLEGSITGGSSKSFTPKTK